MIELFKELFIFFRKVGDDNNVGKSDDEDDSDGKRENRNKISKGHKTDRNKGSKISHL